MIKITGIALIVLSCSMAGIFRASGLSRKVLIIENAVRLCGYMHDRLKYLQPSIASLISQSASSEEFVMLDFLPACRDKMNAGGSFPDSWRESVRESPGLRGNEIAPLITGLGDVLGASDLESQLSALDYCRSMLDSRLIDAREYAAGHKKLYRTLGVLTGLGLAILIA